MTQKGKTNTTKCVKHNPSGIFRSVQNIYVLGDIHGDLESLLQALEMAELIEIEGLYGKNNGDIRWIGGSSYVVQMGDLLDRGGRGLKEHIENKQEEIDIIDILLDLDKQARGAGGRVLCLIGNHELMNLHGDFRYADYDHIQGMGGLAERTRLFTPGGPLALKLASLCYAIIKIDHWVFSHSGILPEHLYNFKHELVQRREHQLHEGGFVAQFDEPFEEEVLERKVGQFRTAHFIEHVNHMVHALFLGTMTLQDMHAQDAQLIMGDSGIFWNRVLGRRGRSDDQTCANVAQTLEVLNPGMNQQGGQIVGHTPQNNINAECNGQLIRVDTGLSGAFGPEKGNRLEVLHIHQDYAGASLEIVQ